MMSGETQADKKIGAKAPYDLWKRVRWAQLHSKLSMNDFVLRLIKRALELEEKELGLSQPQSN